MADFFSGEFTVLFVYGTLRSGGRLHHVLQKSLVYREKLRLEGYVMYDDGRGYPLMIESGSDDYVVGELFVLDDHEGAILRRLDEIEGAKETVPVENRLYRREKREVRQGISAWLYIYNQPVTSGAMVVRDWFKRDG